MVEEVTSVQAPEEPPREAIISSEITMIGTIDVEDPAGREIIQGFIANSERAAMFFTNRANRL